ncbi:hypothetical protein ACHAWT_008792 [Skeletonema menzelii]
MLHNLLSLPAATAFLTCTTNSRPISRKMSSDAVWCPDTQTFKGGIVPRHSDAMTIDELLACNGDKLKIFGYGSLCWNPGSDGVLSLANIEQDEHDHDETAIPSSNLPKRKVTTAPGRAIGYRRCWAQRSADHRGDTEYNGIVCTLLSDQEFAELQPNNAEEEHQSMTEGVIYTVDKDLVQDCLAELDFREKGGYARDTIDVIEDDTGEKFKALLYRGTSENPAFWKRVLFDLPLAAAVMSVARGPSGPNDFYLLQLHSFLTHAAEHSPAAAAALKDHSGDEQTEILAQMCKLLQTNYTPFFLFGTGSNEHNQLLLNSDNVSVEERHELVEILLIAPRSNGDSELLPKSLHAGGGHSALLTHTGELYLWGWNGSGQLGLASNRISDDEDLPFSENVVRPLQTIKVEQVSLGHNHTILIERETGKLFCFGENGRGQVDGTSTTNASIHTPLTPVDLSDDCFVHVAAGLFHSAAITKDGELVTWGCGRFGQSLVTSDGSISKVGRWRPEDGVPLKQVSCGRRHTVILDEIGRVWTMGDNKYGQLGRTNASKSAVPELVSGVLGLPNSGCVQIHSGWSHTIAVVKKKESTAITLFGWGRNERGQLGYKSTEKFVDEPQMLMLGDIEVTSICCGAESSLIVDADEYIYSAGWNEHGNLGFESSDSCFAWRPATGVKVVAPPSRRERKLLAASGGAHAIIMKG